MLVVAGLWRHWRDARQCRCGPIHADSGQGERVFRADVSLHTFLLMISLRSDWDIYCYPGCDAFWRLPAATCLIALSSISAMHMCLERIWRLLTYRLLTGTTLQVIRQQFRIFGLNRARQRRKLGLAFGDWTILQADCCLRDLFVRLQSLRLEHPQTAIYGVYPYLHM